MGLPLQVCQVCGSRYSRVRVHRVCETIGIVGADPRVRAPNIEYENRQAHDLPPRDTITR